MWSISGAHVGTIDTANRIGGLLITSGRSGLVKVWNAGRVGEEVPEEVGTLQLQGEGSTGVVEEAWSEDRAVGLDFVGGKIVGVRQDGIMGVWGFEGGGGRGGSRSVAVGIKGAKRRRLLG